MYFVVMFVHVVVCIFLIIVVLLQSGKAADLAGAFGGMGSQTAFGPRGSATLLSKATTVSAIVFMVTSLSLSILATRNAGLGTSVLETVPQTKGIPATAPAPAPAQSPAPGVPAGAIPLTVTPTKGADGQVKVDINDAIKNGQKAPPPAPTKK
jgi:preprotein translocase subunit SecG